MKVELVPVFAIDQWWSKVGEGFHEALMATGGDCSAGDLWVQARNGSAFLFVAIDGQDLHGASLFRFENWPTGTRFRNLAVFGNDMADWYDLMKAEAMKAAKAGGAAMYVAEGRRGWERKERGAKVLRYLYEVPIDG